jgi:hypothetical protein
MQIVSCEVLLGGDLTNTVVKSNVSIPELAVFSHIHGIGSIQNIKVQGKDNRTSASERERLVSIFGEKVVSALFPGAVPTFPKRLSEIGLSDEDEPASKSKETAE